ncbi:MAG TPA: hypothetical protein VGR29_01085, partial [Thermomicrobiales bacterium]|nr:hypothetical protein [Thermomicrobiales bacterium]
MAEATVQQALPHWNLDQYFPGLSSPEFASAVEEMKSDTASFSRLVEEITSRESSSDVTADADSVLDALIRLLDRVSIIMPYVHL